eukprot:EG_transcript_24033
MGEAAALRGRLDACLTATLEHRRARLATAAPPSGMPRGSDGEDGTPASEVPGPRRVYPAAPDAGLRRPAAGPGPAWAERADIAGSWDALARHRERLEERAAEEFRHRVASFQQEEALRIRQEERQRYREELLDHTNRMAERETQLKGELEMLRFQLERTEREAESRLRLLQSAVSAAGAEEGVPLQDLRAKCERLEAQVAHLQDQNQRLADQLSRATAAAHEAAAAIPAPLARGEAELHCRLLHEIRQLGV